MNIATINRRPARIYALTESETGPELCRISIPARRQVLKTHYNEDLVRLHPQLLRSLRMKGRAGLYLFHGDPGTGKRGYVRILLSQLNKCCIFLTPRTAAAIDHIALAGTLLRNPESILVIEGADVLNAPALVSRLVEVTGSVPGASLGIQILCIFNAPLRTLSQEILQGGQLLGEYEFGPLAAEKARLLLRAAGLESQIDSPMTLGEIFNRRRLDFAGLI